MVGLWTQCIEVYCRTNVALKKNLNEDQIASILYDTLDGLDYLHNQIFLIHRDIKAGNVFITENGELKLGWLSLNNRRFWCLCAIKKCKR